jgi:NAD-dependent DNA ligase
MNWKETYTKIFLKQSGKAITKASLQEYMPVWWQNTRNQAEGGLRLTDEGYRFVTEDLELATYDVPYPKEFELTTQTIIFLDKFIDCPYYMDKRGLVVTDEKKAVELHLFSGDIRKYGLMKAMKRQKGEDLAD